MYLLLNAFVKLPAVYKLLNLSNELEFYKQFYLNKSEELIDESKIQNKFENFTFIISYID